MRFSVFFLCASVAFFAVSTSANRCDEKCTQDADCHNGGFISCGTCNLVGGTQGYETCIEVEESGTCLYSCEEDSDCENGEYNLCTKCGKFEGAEYYQECYNPAEGEETEGLTVTNPAPSPTEYFPDGGSCSDECETDSDCQNGGYNPCGKCGQYEGSIMYQKCYQPTSPTPAPTSDTAAPTSHNYFPDGGSCSDECEADSDCQHGGYNPCGSCGQFVGTLMYQKCYAPSNPTPAPTTDTASPTTDTATPTSHNYFPDGGSCSDECEADSDCQHGGYNPCGSCGQFVGTLMYQKCYNPSGDE